MEQLLGRQPKLSNKDSIHSLFFFYFFSYFICCCCFFFFFTVGMKFQQCFNFVVSVFRIK